MAKLRFYITLSLFGLLSTAAGSDSLRKAPSPWSIHAYADVYYALDFGNNAFNERLYAYSSATTDQLTPNLAFVSFDYNGKRSRFNASPGLGSYMQANYAAESEIWQYVYELRLGFKPRKNTDWWIDAGVFGSPYGNESAVAMDQLSYTRSLSSEFSPYYLSGIRSIHKKGNLQYTGYLLNGWQQINWRSINPALGANISWDPKPGKNAQFSVFAGSMNTKWNPNLGMRYFADFHTDFATGKRVTQGICITGGNQFYEDSVRGSYAQQWGTLSYQLRYAFAQKHFATGRVEAYLDPENTIIPQYIGWDAGFTTLGLSLCYTWKYSDNLQLRIEGKHYRAQQNVHLSRYDSPGRTNSMVAAAIMMRI